MMRQATSGYVDCGQGEPLPVGSVTFSSTGTYPGTIWISAEDVVKKPMTELELLDELYKELAFPALEDGEVTAQMVAQYTGVSWSTASRALKAKESAGQLASRVVRQSNGRTALAYRKAV